MKLGLLAHDFIGWGGGIDFLRTVIDSLLATSRREASEFHLLIPDSGPRLGWRRIRRRVKQSVRALLSGQRPISDHAPSSRIVTESFDGFRGRIQIQHIDIGRRALLRAAKRLGLEVLVPAVHSLGADYPLPWVAYAYDFQHKYFPQNFPPDDRRSRDEHFSRLLTQSKAVIVNSRAAAADIARFVPQATARVFALPFAPAPNHDWLENCPGVLSRHGVSQPFFMISNQFWAHKGHETAFKAFCRLAAAHPEVSLVCTGSTAGSNDPEYFPGLVAGLKREGMEPRVRILGLIPKRDQIELMKHACAVIQPTLFEGGPGGGAVYDAVSLDVPAIVSDIPVNREIEADRVVFFPVGDDVALARQMEASLPGVPRSTSAEELIARGQRRRAACGEVVWQAIDCVR